MESQTTFVWSDCTVELYTITFVYLYNTFIVYPRNSERDDSFRLNKTFQNGKLAVFLFIFVDYDFKGV